MLSYDPVLHRPHPPGYPLYIAVAKMVEPLFGDANATMVALSIFSTALAVALIYFAGQRLFNRRVGLMAAFMLFASPLVWFFSEVAFAYAVQLPFAVLATWLLCEMWLRRRYAFWAALVIGIGAGFRQDVMLFFGPFFMAASLRLGIRRMLASWLALALAVTTWLVPFALSLESLAEYNQANTVQSQLVASDSLWVAGVSGISKNVEELLWGLFLLLGVAGLLISSLALLMLGQQVRRDSRVWFLLALCVWPLVFYLVTFFHYYAYVMIIAPAAFLLAAFAAIRWVELAFHRWPGRVVGSAVTVLLLAAVSLGQVVFFGVSALPSEMSRKLGSFSQAAIERVDRETAALIAATRQHDPDATLVLYVAAGEEQMYFRQSNYYLPEYRQVWLRPESGAAYYDNWMSIGRQYRGEDLRISLLGQEQVLVIGQADVPGEQLPAIGPRTPVTLVRIPAGGSLTIGPYTIMP